MASIFGHAISALAIGSSLKNKGKAFKFWLLAIGCAILPDADVIGFYTGVAYESFWGHRGFTHSLLFAAIMGVLITLLFYWRHNNNWRRIGYFLCFTVCTASHSVLDAMTTGGRGVAFLSPWDTTRYFFPWRPIKVSPIGISNFFSEWGMRVILSELQWIFIPSLCYILLIYIIRRMRSN